jgi:quercetin dioxygenase-like cupin family protein
MKKLLTNAVSILLLASSVGAYSSSFANTQPKPDVQHTSKHEWKGQLNASDTPKLAGNIEIHQIKKDKTLVIEPYKGVKMWKVNPKNGNGQFFVADFKKGAKIPSHVHDTDQITYLTKGKVRIIQGSENKVFNFKEGDYFVLPHSVYHSLEAIDDSEMIAVNPSTISGKSQDFKH